MLCPFNTQTVLKIAPISTADVRFSLRGQTGPRGCTRS